MLPTTLTTLLASGRDWLNLLLLGVFAEWAHRRLNTLGQWALGPVVVNATFSHTDPSYSTNYPRGCSLSYTNLHPYDRVAHPVAHEATPVE
jgi:hypothetical protein